MAIEKVFVASGLEGETLIVDGPRKALKDQKCLLYLIIQANDHGRTVYYGDAAEIRVHDRRIHLQPFPDKKGWEPRWFKIEPVMYHVDGHGHDPASPGFLWY